MAYNVPLVTQNNISFGPAKVLIGTYVSGSACTPAVDVGALSEDGVNIEVTSEKRYINQGNPLSAVYAFSTTQGVKVSFTSLQWSFDRFIDALVRVTPSQGRAAMSASSGAAIHSSPQSPCTCSTSWRNPATQ